MPSRKSERKADDRQARGEQAKQKGGLLKDGNDHNWERPHSVKWLHRAYLRFREEGGGALDEAVLELMIAIDANNKVKVKKALQSSSSGAILNRSADEFPGHTPLFLAVHQDRVECTRLLLDAGADIHPVYEDTGSVLHLACSPDDDSDNSDMVRLLTSARALVDERDRSGLTPLMHACIRGMPEVVKELLSAGANARLTNLQQPGARQMTAGITSVLANGKAHLVTALWLSKAPTKNASGDRKACAAHLIAAGADRPCQVLRATEEGDEEALGRLLDEGEGPEGTGGFTAHWLPGATTPLMVAARRNCLNCVQRLLSAKADPHVQTLTDGSALSFACIFGANACAEALLAASASAGKPPPALWAETALWKSLKAVQFNTVPMAALCEANPALMSLKEKTVGMPSETARLLIDHGVRFDAQWQREQALIWPRWLLQACERGHLELVELLLDAGLSPNVETVMQERDLEFLVGMPTPFLSGHEKEVLTFLQRAPARPSPITLEDVLFELSATYMPKKTEILRAIRKLANHGVDADEEGRVVTMFEAWKCHRTPLFAALRAASPAIIKLLLARGAEPMHLPLPWLSAEEPQAQECEDLIAAALMTRLEGARVRIRPSQRSNHDEPSSKDRLFAWAKLNDARWGQVVGLSRGAETPSSPAGRGVRALQITVQLEGPDTGRTTILDTDVRFGPWELEPEGLLPLMHENILEQERHGRPTHANSSSSSLATPLLQEPAFPAEQAGQTAAMFEAEFDEHLQSSKQSALMELPETEKKELVAFVKAHKARFDEPNGLLGPAQEVLRAVESGRESPEP